MPVQEEAVGADAYMCRRPVPADQNEFAEVRMDRRFAAEQVEFLDPDAVAPARHPAIGRRRIEIAAVTMVGIMRAALARQSAGVGDMQFEPRHDGASHAQCARHTQKQFSGQRSRQISAPFHSGEIIRPTTIGIRCCVKYPRVAAELRTSAMQAMVLAVAWRRSPRMRCVPMTTFGLINLPRELV